MRLPPVGTRVLYFFEGRSKERVSVVVVIEVDAKQVWFMELYEPRAARLRRTHEGFADGVYRAAVEMGSPTGEAE